METAIVPQSYDEWYHWITVVGQQKLTMPFIETRIKCLNSLDDASTQRFVQLYGEQQRLKTIEWFERAKKAIQ